MGPPILGRVPYVQNSLLDKDSVAGRGGSSLAITQRAAKGVVQEGVGHD